MTVSQIRRLGDRLRHSATPSKADLAALQQLRAEYDAPLQVVETTLRGNLSLRPTSRLKTVKPIIEKLVRERTRLNTMEDIAGARIVITQQDDLVRQIQGSFDSTRVRDRRADPSHGYRAVHVIVTIDDFPVEVQVRTVLQDLWAEGLEALADRWGRQIRYDELPDRAEESFYDEDNEDNPTGPTRSEVVAVLVDVSRKIADVESTPDSAHKAKLQKALRRFLAAFRASP